MSACCSDGSGGGGDHEITPAPAAMAPENDRGWTQSDNSLGAGTSEAIHTEWDPENTETIEAQSLAVLGDNAAARFMKSSAVDLIAPVWKVLLAAAPRSTLALNDGPCPEGAYCGKPLLQTQCRVSCNGDAVSATSCTYDRTRSEAQLFFSTGAACLHPPTETERNNPQRPLVTAAFTVDEFTLSNKYLLALAFPDSTLQIVPGPASPRLPCADKGNQMAPASQVGFWTGTYVPGLPKSS